VPQEMTVRSGEKTVSRGAKRVEWIDTARGIGIILVVYGHVLLGLVAAGVLSEANPLWLSDYAIYTFHMPLFFVLAGLNVERSIAKGRRTFFLGKLWTIAYPYILWSAIQGGIQLLFPAYVNRQRSPMFLATILWRPIGQFWFLYSLFICHMIALIVGRRKWLLTVLAIAAYCLSVFDIGKPTTYVLIFYVAGILIGERVKGWAPSAKASAIGALCCALLFAVAEHFGRSASGAEATSIFSLPATVTGIVLLCMLSNTIAGLSGGLTKILTGLGVMSMTIYILHVLAATGARMVLKRLGLVSLPEELSAGVVAGVGLPVIAHLMFQRLNLLTALGLAPLKPRAVESPASLWGTPHEK